MGIRANPNYTVYFGDIYFEIPENSPNKSFSRLLPDDRIGQGRELFSVDHGIANTAILRKMLPPLIDPFRLDFNAGGEDVSFFERLKAIGFRFYELSGAAVTEEWELSRLQGKALSYRNKRGISAYYKLRQERKGNNWSDRFETSRIFSRIFLAVLIAPALAAIQVINILNPNEVAKIQIRCYISKIFYVSIFPWKIKIRQIVGSKKP
jgi:hypothetical protein